MASAGSATAGLRHSFLAPGTSDRATAKKVARTPSMPTHKSGAAVLDRPSGGGAASRARTKRASGLFESSDSGSDDAAADHEPSPTERRPQRKQAPPPDAPPATTRHYSLPGRENSAINERKGLFEFDDDAADSVETLRARVKLRQRKKEHEMDTLRGELESALARAAAVSAELARERKEKEEFAIRMDECQRIIEKRNKQLIKASEKLARLAEQSESQTSELQQRVQELQQEIEQTRALERVALERQRAEFEEKLAQQRARLESQLENVTLAAAEKLRMKEADEGLLRKRITQLEADVVGATSRMFESSEYQNLLKRCEDAEAITRGLRFQLEKAQNEKKYLKKQLVAASAPTSSPGQTGSTPSPAFVPAVDLFAELSAGREQSPTSSVASADLSSFDFSRAEMSPPMSPVGASRPQPATAPPSTSSSSSSSRKPNLKVSTAPETQRRVHIDEPNRGETSSKDSLESVYGGTNDGDEEEEPPMPPLTTSQSDRSESRTRPGSGSINFFEKISIKFKRSASSPRNSTPTTRSFDEAEQKATTTAGHTAGGASSQSQPPGASSSAPIDIPPAHRRKVLPKRPKMYVAKSLSDYEESSDSIFGSDSDSDVSSDEDDQPPPPPPNGLPRSPTGSVGTSSATMPPPPPPPPLFADASEDEGDSSSDGSEARSIREDLRRVILPTPVSPPVVPQEQNRTERSTTKMAPTQSSSEDSDSEHSASSEDERNAKASQATTSTPVRAGTGTPKPHHVPSSSESELEESTRRSEKHRRRVGTDDASGVRATSSKASAEPRKEKRERSRSTEGDAGSAAAAKVNRMNEYMEARARKRQEKLSKKEEKEIAESKKREEYEKEWERMAEEERERRRKQQKARRTGKRRPSSMKTVRVSQMRHQMNKHQKDAHGALDEAGEAKGDDSDDENGPPQPDAQRAGYQSSGSESSDEETEQQRSTTQASSPPLPPEPTAVNTDLYLRQQARLREHHEMELKKKQDSEEADQVRGQIHRRVEMWAFAKELHHMILTLDQISSNEALKQCQLMVVQSPDPETLRKAYRNIIRVIHPDKLRNATITEQLEAKELFTVLNQAFEKFKAQQQ